MSTKISCKDHPELQVETIPEFLEHFNLVHGDVIVAERVARGGSFVMGDARPPVRVEPSFMPTPPPTDADYVPAITNTITDDEVPF